jgi:hypothetical protein
MVLSAGVAGIWRTYSVVRVGVGAVAIGAIGSSAYFAALMLGFLGDAPIAQLRPKFLILRGSPLVGRLGRGRVAIFIILGSFVALVFQLAQQGSFAPVQSFVLGATWPSVVSQYLARSRETLSEKVDELSDRVQSGKIRDLGDRIADVRPDEDK